MTATLTTVLPWTEMLTVEQRVELLRDIALATTDPAVEQRESLLADVLDTWENFAHDENGARVLAILTHLAQPYQEQQ